ncbi:hypothetical protein BJY04DRAFT_213573 [Aspergillus karnatakaensis]|uniref:uncharacterized protein n=1 Tax=Aspergillus karnatakaensis TaxID=1810916 RepID=UPI003CCDF87E
MRGDNQGDRFPDTRTNQLTQHEARGLPNQALRRAFGVQNAFTTDNAPAANEFVRHVRGLITTSAVDSTGLSRTLSSMLLNMDWALTDIHRGVRRRRVPLAPLVRALALKASLTMLFKTREGIDLENKRLSDLGNIIHKSWMDMKSAREEVMEFKDNSILKERLSAVFGKHEVEAFVKDPQSNPLNLILPSFETLWRIVLRLFLVILNQDDYHQALLDFVQTPTPTQFKLALGQDGISAELLVKEALRLYPPTRRIRRAYQFADDDSITTVAADIEACQLDKNVWGADALQFNPARWRKGSASDAESRKFLAFGSRPFLCPASNEFGSMMIGLLAGILLGVVTGRTGPEWVLGSDSATDMEELHTGKRLRNDRDAYERVFLELTG